MIFDAKGSLYGTTTSGGNPKGDGTIFKLVPPKQGGSWQEQLLQTFYSTGDQNGAFPSATLVFDSSGNWYGTAAAAGEFGGGTIFQFVPSLKESKLKIKVLHAFSSPPDGHQPESGLVLGSMGELYGTTLYGGTGTACDFGCGTVYELQP
jgi:uncharacterized repeat protein (TIGR03803 family)